MSVFAVLTSQRLVFGILELGLGSYPIQGHQLTLSEIISLSIETEPGVRISRNAQGCLRKPPNYKHRITAGVLSTAQPRCSTAASSRLPLSNPFTER